MGGNGGQDITCVHQNYEGSDHFNWMGGVNRDDIASFLWIKVKVH